MLFWKRQWDRFWLLSLRSEFRIVHLLNLLSPKTTELNVSYYLTRDWGEESGIYTFPRSEVGIRSILMKSNFTLSLVWFFWKKWLFLPSIYRVKASTWKTFCLSVWHKTNILLHYINLLYFCVDIGHVEKRFSSLYHFVTFIC